MNTDHTCPAIVARPYSSARFPIAVPSQAGKEVCGDKSLGDVDQHDGQAGRELP